MAIHLEFLPALFLLLVIPGLYFIYKKYNSETKSATLKFSSLNIIKKSISGAGIRKHLPFVLLVGIITLIIIGLADPQIPTDAVLQGINVVLVLDGSESMIANDYEPSRLEAAKNAATILVSGLNPNDNVGIVLFESGATTVSYLTPSKEKTLNDLASIEQRQGGTALGDGIVLGVDMASSMPDKKNVIILLSDGVHNSGFTNPEEAMQYAQLNKITIHTIGMGSNEPVFIKNDIYGEPQYAELDEDTLQEISKMTGGKYFMSVNEDTLNEIFTILSSDIQRQIQYSSVGHWFFAGAIALLLANAYVIYGRYRIVV